MNRRRVLIALFAVMAAMVGKVTGQTVITNPWKMTPGSLRFDLRAYKDFTFTLDGHSVTFTPEELMQELVLIPTPKARKR